LIFNQFTPNDIDRYHPLSLSASVASRINYLYEIKQHIPFTARLTGNSTVILSTVQPYSVCKFFISTSKTFVDCRSLICWQEQISLFSTANSTV